MWTMEGDYAMLQYYGKLKVLEEETYASLRVHFEENSTLECPLEFWDNDNKCRI